MTDLKEKARRLIELEIMRPAGTWAYAPAIARAYLDQCEENERLRFALRSCVHRIERPELSPDANVVLEQARKALGDTDV